MKEKFTMFQEMLTLSSDRRQEGFTEIWNLSWNFNNKPKLICEGGRR